MVPGASSARSIHPAGGVRASARLTVVTEWRADTVNVSLARTCGVTISNVADVAPSGTVTNGGTIPSSYGTSSMSIPPAGAGAVSETVPVTRFVAATEE